MQGLLAMQAPLLLFHLTALVPIAQLADQLRQQPVRGVARQMLEHQRPGEPLAMIGAMKPSLHFYTNQVIVYEGRSDGALVNLADRLSHERRRGWVGRPPGSDQAASSVLVAIDRGTVKQPHWQDLAPEVLGHHGIYQLWRVNRDALQGRADALMDEGVEADWDEPRPERY